MRPRLRIPRLRKRDACATLYQRAQAVAPCLPAVALCEGGFCRRRHTEITCLTMLVHHDQLEVRTHGKGLYEITDDVQSKVDKSGVRNGTVSVFVQHTSCSIVIMENADPTARRDLEEFFDRLVPEDADYFTHDAEGSDDMPSHIRMVLTRTSETVPIV